MSGEARYAVYFAPHPNSALWRFGSAVLGYDAATGEDVAPLVPDGWNLGDWMAATAEPRRYGFHATLKAPFRLATDRTEATLAAALARFSQEYSAPVPIRLQVNILDGFVALVPTESAGIAALEATVLRAFDAFRAPLTAQERARRRPETLTLRQAKALDAWGYPYVLDDFRFHMTLTGRLQADRAESTRAALAELAERAGLGRETAVDRLALFRQPTPADRFTIIAAATLAGRVVTRSDVDFR
jgi:putative phosphonate metabolism protein